PINATANPPQIKPQTDQWIDFQIAIRARTVPIVSPNLRLLGPAVRSSRLKSSCRVPVVTACLSIICNHRDILVVESSFFITDTPWKLTGDVVELDDVVFGQQSQQTF